MKLIDSMLAEVSPEMQSHALDFLSTVGAAIRSNDLLPAKLRAELPPLGATEGESDPFALVKFFTPDGNWTWYVLEFDGDDTFFGFVNGFERELGCFSLSELVDRHRRFARTL